MNRFFKTVAGMLLCFSMLISGLAITGQTAGAKTYKWSDEGGGRFFNGDRHIYYMVGNDLYRSAYNKRVIRSGKKIDSFSCGGGQYLKVVHGHKNQIYISKQSNNGGSGTLMSYNIVTKKRATVNRGCAIVAGKGAIMYDAKRYPTDVSTSSINILKLSGNSTKKIGTLGSRIYGFKFANGKLYYGQYSGAGKMNNLTVYSSKLDGKSKKKLFNVSVKSKYGQIYIDTVNSKKVTVNSTSGAKYEYDLKTKKLKKTR